MMITSASPVDLIDWFHNRQNRQRVLCLLLAPSSSDQTHIAEVVESVFATDAKLGREIAVLLFHPNVRRELGIESSERGCMTFPGKEFPTLNSSDDTAYPLRDLQMFRDMRSEVEPYRAQVAKESAQATARFVLDLMELCAVKQEEIPAACLLVQGLERSVVVPLGKDWTADTLYGILASARQALDGQPNLQSQLIQLAIATPEAVKSLSELVRELDAKRKKIEAGLERLLNKHSGTEEDRTLISNFVAAGCKSAAEFDQVVRRLSFVDRVDLLKDIRYSKLPGIMCKIEEIHNRVDTDNQSRAYVLSVGDQAKRLVEQRAALYSSLSAIRGSRFVATSGGWWAQRRIAQSLNGINLAGDLGEKLITAIGWVGKLVRG